MYVWHLIEICEFRKVTVNSSKNGKIFFDKELL